MHETWAHTHIPKVQLHFGVINEIALRLKVCTAKSAQCRQNAFASSTRAAITSCVPENQLEVIFRVLPGQVVDCLFAHNRQPDAGNAGKTKPNRTESNPNPPPPPTETLSDCIRLLYE